ncbi:MAG TPA: glycosyltransferase family 2 protein [Acidobacteriota bacterium]|nr:glycosyltransferase family 2 protein [Acidobacteriota bacterium]
MQQKLPTTPTISVIVATRNRRAALEQFLASARGLPMEPQWELIVVDNGSSDGTNDLLASATVNLPLLVLQEPQQGKSRALNKGLTQARGEILLFADDDIMPDRQWLTELYQASLDYAEANVFGGRILLNYETLPAWVTDSFNLKTILASEQDLGDDFKWFERNQYPVGPNLAVRRRALECNHCAWPVNLGPGTKLPLGDERAFLMRVSSPSSRDRLYVPGSVVRHNVGGRELKMTNAATRCFLGGYAAGLVNKRHGQRVSQHGVNLPTLTRQRYRQSASARELVCSLARAAGVITGTISPFPRIIHG